MRFTTSLQEEEAMGSPLQPLNIHCDCVKFPLNCRVMRYPKSLLIFLLGLAAVFLPAASMAASFDPGAHWKTIETKHFRVHYPERINDAALRSAHILEEIFPEVTEKWSWKPWGYTEVVLVDNTDEANGMSSVLPYNWMLIFVAPPDPDSSLAHYNDWLKMLLIHEFTHIVQFDANGGVWRFLRIFLGKTVSPSGIDPVWMKEGSAQYSETVLTEGGRGRGAFSEMVVRTAILEDAFPTIDVADGLSWRWPGYKTAYVYGIKFIQWLSDTYGEDKFLEFDRNVRSSILLGMINHQAKRVYGKTFYQLWREWKWSLEGRYAVLKARTEAGGITEPKVLMELEREKQYASPTPSPDGTRLAYVVTSPFGKAEIRVMDIASGEDKLLKKGQEAVQLSWSPDGKKIVYSAIGSYKKYNRFYDLWLYDFDSGKAKRLTSGERARDPDFAPDGKSIVFVASEEGTDTLKRIDTETKKISLVTPNVFKTMQFANPRFSPDGKFIAASVWKSGDGWRVHRLNEDGTNPLRLTAGKGLVIESRPAWTPDGRSVIFSSDETGINNLYLVSADGGGVKRVTNVLTGAFQPSPLPGGDVIAQYYTAKGYEIAKFAVAFPEGSDVKKGARRVHKKEGAVKRPDSKDSATKDTVSLRGAGSSGEFDFKPRKYAAFGQSLFLPRFIAPTAAYTGDTFFFSLLTGGADVLRWHNWLASGTYRSDANYFGYFLQYWYNRYRPVFGATLNDYAVNFGNITFQNTVIDPTTGTSTTTFNTVHYYEKRRAISAFFSIPIRRHNIALAYYFEDHMPKTALTAAEKGALNLGHFAGFRFDYRYGDAERYPASISPENGRTIRLTTSVTDTKFGSSEKNEQVIFSGDWREYIKLWRRNIFALRAAGGITWGDPLVQGTFGLGGDLGEGSFGGAGSYNYFPLRGLPVSALSRSRAMLFSGEYRFPVMSPHRGLGTAPLFLKEISGSLFADYGNAWNAHENGSDSFSKFFSEFMLSLGAEIRGDFVVGHGLPVHGRLGYAVVVVNNDRASAYTDPITGADAKYGLLILALGASF